MTPVYHERNFYQLLRIARKFNKTYYTSAAFSNLYIHHKNVVFQRKVKITDISYSRACLTFQSLAVTLHTARFNIKKFYVVPTLRLCVLYGSQNKQQLLPHKALRYWFL
jgi:hypothetical protein